MADPEDGDAARPRREPYFARPAQDEQFPDPGDDFEKRDHSHRFRRLLGREVKDVGEIVEFAATGDFEDVSEAWADLQRAMRQQAFGPDSFVPVLILALVVVILIPIAEDGWLGRLLVILLSTLLLVLILRRSQVSRRARTRTYFLAGFLTVLGTASQLHTAISGEQPLEAVVATTAGAYVLIVSLSIPAILRQALLAKRVTMNTLSAALAAYLLLGLFFAGVFRFIDIMTPPNQPFFNQTSTPTQSDYEYFSFITITTVGYGDLTPGDNVARAGAVSEAVIGQVFLVTVVARVVSILGTERRAASAPEPPPAADAEGGGPPPPDDP